MVGCGLKIGILNGKSLYCGDVLLGKKRYCISCCEEQDDNCTKSEEVEG